LRLKIWQRLSPASDGTDADIALLYEREAPRMRQRLLRRFPPEKAADIVQTAFVRLLGLGAERLEAMEQPRAYLYRVAENLAHDVGKSAAYRLEQQQDVEWAVREDPHAALEARDFLHRIEAAISVLPDRTREIFMAHRFENLTYGEIAARHGVSISSVEKEISAALRALHGAIGGRP
jgi:RNA polymerase sigma-70 factor (ECF subfamily)